jgi:F-type H+-transporting ATPase subunit b
MHVDLVTVAAQVVNFLLLVWLLRKFLYKRVLDAMRRREERIAQSIQGAKQHERDAESERNTYRARVREFDEQRDEMLADARKSADAERARLYDALHAEIEDKQKQWRRQLETQRAEFLDQLERQSANYAVALAGRVLRDLGDAKLEEQIVRVFLRRLKETDDAERRKMADVSRNSGMLMTLRSRFELDSSDRRTITAAIHESILADAEVTYEHDSESTPGIELIAGGQTLRWSFDSYLEDLSREMSRYLDETAAEHGIGRA